MAISTGERTTRSKRGIGLCALTEAIDTTTASGRLLFGILASLAEFERKSFESARQPVWRRLVAKAVIARTIGVSRPTFYNYLSV